MKVLVPIDGSAHSMEALRVAAEFAVSKQADIYVISVAPFIGGMEDHEISPSRRDRYMEANRKRADEAVKLASGILAETKVSAAFSKVVETSVSVPDAIIETAEEERADLIVMGSRGLSTSSRFKLGSVASQVAKYCPCSIYLVKAPSGQ